MALLIPIGVDIGQLHDPSAIAVLQPASAHPSDSSSHKVRRLRRLPVRMDYPTQAAELARLIAQLHRHLTQTLTPRPRFEVRMDVTGVGRPVFDLLTASLNRPDTKLIAVTLTSGQDASRSGREWHVPKNDLISNLVALVQTNRLRFTAADPETPALLAELRDFRAHKSASDSISSGAKAGSHDDLVIALGLAALDVDASPRHNRVRGSNISGSVSRPVTTPIPGARLRGGQLVTTPSGEVAWEPLPTRS